MSADTLLSRLDKVRRTSTCTWLACCPAHEDRSASLSIRETGDGRILLHCFAGCSVHEVVDAVHLDIADLFPPRDPDRHAGKPERRPFPAMDALRAVAFEALVVATAARSVVTGRGLSQADGERIATAAARINAALSAVAPNLRGVRHG